jgi:GDP-L-fucose synthase
MISKKSKVFIAGHKGMVGSAIERLLITEGFTNIITKNKIELNLLDTKIVRDFLIDSRPDYVILAAAKVGGIRANMTYPVEFLNENIIIQNNIINESFKTGVKKIIFLGSSCIYPRDCMQPMKEEYLLSGKLESTNEGYALAKIVGLKLLEFYYKQFGYESISLMPCNLYGTNDSFSLEHSHVLSALVRKFVDAVDNKVEEIEIWGTGTARREFMHVDDFAKAVLYMMNNYSSSEFINIGWGTDLTIKDLALLISSKVNFKGRITWDLTKPDGMQKKCLDVSKMLSTGFQPTIEINEGIIKTINEYKEIKSKSIL